MENNNTKTTNGQAFASNFINAGTGAWADPTPLSEENDMPTPYPVDALGATIAGAVNAISEVTDMQPAIAAQACLASANLAVQQFGNVHVNGLRPTPVSLFLLSIAASGDRKTAADHWALKPLHELEKLSHEEFEGRQKEYAKSLLGVKKGELEESDLHAEPVSPNFLYSDITSEGLAQDLKCSYAAAGLFSSEGGVFTGGYGMNSDNRTKTAGCLSQFWDGSTVKISRKKEGGNIYLTNKRFCMHLALQPRLASELYSDGMLKDQGFLARMLPAFPAEREVGTYKDVDLEGDERLKAFHAKIRSAHSKWSTPEASQKPGFNFTEVRLSLAAQEAWVLFYNETEKKRKTDYDTIKDFANKAPEHLLRLAGTLALFENPYTAKVELQHIQQGQALMRYYIAECLRLANPVKAPQSVRDAEKLLVWLREKNVTAFDKTTLGQSGPYSTRKPKQRDAAIALLTANFFIRPKDNGWEVNPAVFESSEKNSRLLAVA